MNELTDDVNWTKIIFFTIGAFLYIYMMNKNYPDLQYYFPYAVVHVLSFIYFVNIGSAVKWKLRYKSPQFVAHGVHGSIQGKPEYIPDPTMGDGFHWAIINLGHVGNTPLRGQLATAIVPANQLQEVGDSLEALTLVQLYPLNLLPAPVNFYLRQENSRFNTNQVYFGKFSKAFIDKSALQQDLQSQLNAKNSEINVLRKSQEGKFGDFEDIQEMAKRITGDKFSFKNIIKKAVKPEDEG